MRQKFSFLLVFMLILAVAPVMAQEGDMAWVRVFHLATDWTDVDVYYGGDLILPAVAPGLSTYWLPVQLDTITVSIAEIGTGMVNTVLEVTDVNLEAGHRYTIAIIGKMGDNTLSTLLIDETEEIAGFDMSQGSAVIVINNAPESPSISWQEDGILYSQNIGYREFEVSFLPSVRWDTSVIFEHNNPDKIIYSFDAEQDGSGGFWEPYSVYLWGLVDEMPLMTRDGYFIAYGERYYVAEDAIQLLQSFTNRNLYSHITNNVVYEFTTFLDLVKVAGLNDILTGDNPITIFAPTDYAFDQLPEGTLDELRATPDSLRRLIFNHLAAGNILNMYDIESFTTLAGIEYTVKYEPNEFTYRINEHIPLTAFNYLGTKSTVWILENVVLLPAD